MTADHDPIEPTNHLEEVFGDLAANLSTLSDRELAEQKAYYRQLSERQPTNFGKWKTSNLSAACAREEDRRVSRS